MMIRARIVVEGDVQKAGYRDEVQEIARELGVKGFVENLRDGNVGIVCEAEEEVINKFVKKIKIKKDFIDVKDVNISEKTKPTAEFEYFDIKYGKIEEELGDRLGAAIKYAGGTWEEVKASREDIKGVRDEVKGSREDIQDMHKDMRKGQNCIKDSIQDMHKDMRKGQNCIKDSIQDMHKDLKDELKGFRNETKTEFQTIKTDYGKISQDLGKAVDSINRIAKSIDTSELPSATPHILIRFAHDSTSEGSLKY